MITLFTWPTPNGRKVSIMLEECGLPYKVHSVDLSKSEQFDPEFLKISPNNKIPAITDDEVLVDGKPLSVFESGAILIYLAEKSGRFLAASGFSRYKTLEWLFWQIGGLGPMLGQLGYFAVRSPEKSELAIGRFTDEVERLLSVMEGHLASERYFAGREYTIADMAIYPWMITATNYLKESMEARLSKKPALTAWMRQMGARPAVVRGMDIPKI